ncbi:MAG: hypothetical protein V1487_01610 [bacterium]
MPKSNNFAPGFFTVDHESPAEELKPYGDKPDAGEDGENHSQNSENDEKNPQGFFEFEFNPLIHSH